MTISIRFPFSARTDHLIVRVGRKWNGGVYAFWAHNTTWKDGSFILREVHEVLP